MLKNFTEKEEKNTLVTSNSEFTIFDVYARDIKNYKLLTLEEEKVITTQLLQGDEKAIAKSKLITSNLRLVLSIAFKFNRCGLSCDDLIQYGNLGLCVAAEKFDPTKGVRFSTYASAYIEGYIHNEVKARGYDSRNYKVWEPIPSYMTEDAKESAMSKKDDDQSLRITRETMTRSLRNFSERDRQIFFDYFYYPKEEEYITNKWHVSMEYVKSTAKLCLNEIKRNYKHSLAA